MSSFGSGKYLTISGMVAGDRIRVKFTPTNNYSVPTAEEYWYDARGVDGTGYGIIKTTGSWYKSGFTLRIGGVAQDPVNSSTVVSGVEVELDLSGAGTGSVFNLFANSAGIDGTTLSTDAIDIYDSAGTTLLHSFDISNPTQSVINDSVGSSTLTLHGFTFGSAITDIDGDNAVYPGQTATINMTADGDTAVSVTLGGSACTLTGSATATTRPVVIPTNLPYGTHQLAVEIPA